MLTDDLRPEETSGAETPVPGAGPDAPVSPFDSDAEEYADNSVQPGTADTSAAEAAVKAAAAEADTSAETTAPEKKKGHKGLWLILAALLLLIGLGCGWYFLLGPGALQEYTVYFDAAGGEPVEPVKGSPRGSITLPVTEKEGCRFVSWTLDGRTVTSPYTVSSDVTLTASWEPLVYNVTYYAKDTDLPDDTWVYPYSYGDPVKFPLEPDRKGYVFSGWKAEDGTEFKENTPMPAHNITLTAEWTQHMLNISFDPAGGSAVSPITIAEGEPFPDIKPTRKDHTFLYWKDPHGNWVYPGDTFLWEDTTLTAVWGIKTFRVTFDSRDGTYVAPIDVNSGDVLHLPSDPKKDYYEFVCWEDANAHPIYDQALLTAEDITLYAVWKRPDLVVTAVGADEIKSQTMNSGTLYLYVYSDWNATMLKANQPVTWTYPAGTGTLYNVTEHATDLIFTAVYSGAGKVASITATADDGQTFTVMVVPEEGHP